MEGNECVAFLLIADEKILLEKRSEHKALDPGLIAIPGGHIEPGESREQALAREMEEELCLKPESCAYLCSLYHPTTELQLIHYYAVSRWSGELCVREAASVAWHPIAEAAVDLEADKVALSEFLRVAGTGMLRF
jgi:mutator protein MutT